MLKIKIVVSSSDIGPILLFLVYVPVCYFNFCCLDSSGATHEEKTCSIMCFVIVSWGDVLTPFVF